MDGRVTPPKRVTSPTWGPSPPCKQALRLAIMLNFNIWKVAYLTIIHFYSLGKGCCRLQKFKPHKLYNFTHFDETYITFVQYGEFCLLTHSIYQS